MTLTTRIKEIRERLGKATPGPWEWQDWNEDDGLNKNTLAARPETRKNHASSMFPELGNCLLSSDDGVENTADAELIAHAPTDLKLLLDIVEKQREALKKIDEAVTNTDAKLWEIIQVVMGISGNTIAACDAMAVGK